MMAINNTGFFRTLHRGRPTQLLAPLMALVLLAAGCERHPDPIDGGGTLPGDGNGNVKIERTIVYTVDNNECRRNLETEADWDALLDELCIYAQNIGEVAFYNISQTTYLHGKAKGPSKDSRTITTSSRSEIKAWMKKMEKEGLTVRVTYDDNSGTWNGVAYATCPVGNTVGNIIGTWHLSCMVVTITDSSGLILSSDLFVPEDTGGSMCYSFNGDGTLTLTVNGMDGSTATENSTWSLSQDGMLSSAILPNGLDWSVNWITNSTMILSRINLGNNDDCALYQIQFDAVTTK